MCALCMCISKLELSAKMCWRLLHGGKNLQYGNFQWAGNAECKHKQINLPPIKCIKKTFQNQMKTKKICKPNVNKKKCTKKSYLKDLRLGGGPSGNMQCPLWEITSFPTTKIQRRWRWWSLSWISHIENAPTVLSIYHFQNPTTNIWFQEIIFRPMMIISLDHLISKLLAVTQWVWGHHAPVILLGSSSPSLFASLYNKVLFYCPQPASIFYIFYCCLFVLSLLSLPVLL